MADSTLAPQGTASPLYNPNAAQGTAGSLAPSPTPYVPPVAASVSSMTTPQTPLKTGTPPSSGLTMADIQGLIDSSTPAIDTAKETGNQEQTTLKSLIDKLGTQGTEQINLENNAGLPAMRSTLNDLTAQMDAVTTRLKSTIIASTNPRGDNTTMFGANAEQNAARREASAQLLGLSAAANTIKGNITTAQTQIDRALKAEFDPINAQIKYWTTALTQNRADMTAAQKQKADMITKSLNEYNLQVKQQQAEKSAVYRIMLDAAKNGANAVTLAKIQAAPDQATAIQIAGSALQTKSSITTKTYTYGGKVYSYHVDAHGTPISAPVVVGGGMASTPPDWFKTQYEASVHANVTPERLQTAWNAYNQQNKQTPKTTYTSTQQNSLIGVGIKSSKIAEIQQYINRYGLQAAIDNSDMTEEQKTAVRAIYRQ